MKRYIPVFAVVLALAGCTTAQIDQGKSLAKQSIAVVCMSYPALDWEFQNIARARQLPANVIIDEQAAIGALAAICEDPPTDTKTAIAAAGRVFNKLLASAAAARKQASG